MAIEKKRSVKSRKELSHGEKLHHHSFRRKLRVNVGKIKPINFLFLTLAGFINGAGVALFLVPWQLLDSGFSGTSYLINYLTDIPLSVWLIVLNFPFFLLAFKRMGLSVVVYSLYAIAMYSLAVFLYQSVFGICGPGPDYSESPFVTKEYDIILAALFGGLISGVGSGLTIRFGGAMDGVEVMGVMFAKRVGLTVGQFVMVYNAVLYILSGFLMGDFQVPLYSVVAYAVGLKAVDFIVDGLDKGKAAIIITGKPAEVGKGISDTMGRGITLLRARGFYSQEEKGMLYCVVNRFEVGTLKKVISALDPEAFVSINEVSDMMGSSDVKLRRRSKRPKFIPPVPPADPIPQTEHTDGASGIVPAAKDAPEPDTETKQEE